MKYKKSKKPKNPAFWQKVAIKSAGLPGYCSLFTAWIFLLGGAVTALYLWMGGPSAAVSQADSSQEAGFAAVSWTELPLMLIVTIVAWTGIAYFSGKIVRWLAGLFSVESRNLTSFKLTLLIIGWLGLLVAVSIPPYGYGYVFLFSGAVAVAVGGLSFALEAFLLKRWRLSSDDTTW